ncbi:MAG TPA: hypothetical protein VE270_13850, partial [Thermoleophilaceae bacterium]|nr:hypothetical protein [Thermoleophilaceae bacterium]
ERKPIDSLCSNIGHLLWSGIVPPTRVDAIVDQLMSDVLWSGWGVRTMSTDDRGYNPLAYHNGTVWPHDNSLIAAGLRRYGHHDAAARIAGAVVRAAGHFDYRLPEVFAGFDEQLTHTPVSYPTASSPQAWAAGAPLLLLTTTLGLSPDSDGVRCDPHLPVHFGHVGLHGIPGRWGRADAVAGEPAARG